MMKKRRGHDDKSNLLQHLEIPEAPTNTPENPEQKKDFEPDGLSLDCELYPLPFPLHRANMSV